MAFSTRINVLKSGGCGLFGLRIASRTVLQESKMVIRSGDVVLRCLMILFLMTEDYGTQYQNLSSGQ